MSNLSTPSSPPASRPCPRLGLFVGALLFTACTSGPGGLPADVVLLNGNVITVDAADRIAEAVAVRDGKIVAVGSDREIERLIGPETRQVDLMGRTATPGLMDNHAHFSGPGDRLDLSYPNVKSVRDVVALVKEKVEELEPGEWVRGRGWDEGKFEERRYIYASDLDPVSPDNPVVLTHTMGHYSAANSLALRIAEISRDTPDPFGGTIDRATGGTATGVLKESAQRLVSRMIPPLTPEEEAERQREGLRQIARSFNEECMTGLKDPGISADKWDAYQRVQEEGTLNVRVFVLWRGGRSAGGISELIDRIAPFTKPYRSTGDDHLISGGVKLAIDGSGGARTAWLYDEWNRDYEDVDEGNYGYPTTEPEVLREQIRMIHDAGIHMSIHSIGDRGIDWVVDSYWLALEANPIQGLRHGIIHINIPTDHAIDRLAEMQRLYGAGYPEPQPTFMWWIGDTYSGNFGPERSLRLNPFRTYEEKGILWSGGSDYGVTPFPARYGVWSAVARETLLGVYGSQPYGTDESVDVRTALRAYTMGTAHQMFMEDKIGSIEVGKYADIAVWDRDLYTVETAALEDMKCEMTIFNGKIVFGDTDSGS
jgi:predicted amidohydrolase YtcJ